MDAFIIAFSNLCKDLLPILGAVCLVCIIILLIKLIKVMSSVDSTLLKTHGTIDLVDRSIEKVQAPLDTVVKNAGDIKERVIAFVKEEEKKDELKEPSPEDIIGGR